MKSDLEGRIAIAVCDTQPLFAEGLRRVLAESDSYTVLEPSHSLEDAVRQVLRLSPRVLILDKALGVPVLLETLTRLRGCSQSAPVILGNSMSESDALRFLKAGAKGIVRKTSPVHVIYACLDAVVNGGTWMEESFFQETAPGERHCQPDLTLREQQVLELVEQGLRNKDIGEQLGIQPGTVKIHLKHIFEKTGIRGRYGLALSSIRTREQMQFAEV